MPAIVDELRQRAEEAAQAETAYRAESRDRLATLEQARVAAYRRIQLVNALTGAIGAGEDRATGTDAAVFAVCDMTGWSPTDAAYDEVRSRLGVVADEAWLVEHPGDAKGAPASIAQAFTSFEAWYAERFGTPFTSLLARETSNFSPLVDF